MKHRWVEVLGSVVLLTVLAGMCIVVNQNNEVEAVEDTREIVKIAYLPTTHSLSLLAQAELEKENPDYRIQLVKYGTWPDLTDALNSGQVDGAVELTELGMQAEANGIPIQAVALGHRDGNVVVTSDEIHSVADLKGKSFAIPSKLSSHNVLLHQMLENNGIQLEDISVVELSPSEMPFALVSGQIAGYCVAEPFGAKAIHADVAHVQYKSSELWEDSICCALVFQEKFLEEKQELAKEVIGDYKDAGSYLEENSEEALAIGETYLSVDKEVLSVSLAWISFSDLEITKDAYDDLSKYLKEYEIMKEPPLYEDFVAQGFY